MSSRTQVSRPTCIGRSLCTQYYTASARLSRQLTQIYTKKNRLFRRPTSSLIVAGPSISGAHNIFCLKIIGGQVRIIESECLLLVAAEIRAHEQVSMRASNVNALLSNFFRHQRTWVLSSLAWLRINRFLSNLLVTIYLSVNVREHARSLVFDLQNG